MPYIYKITNNINNKIYIGMTVKTIEERWIEHLRDSKRENIQNRPLYKAINKYGSENFKVEELEEVLDENQLFEKEKYWIEYFEAYKYGYNATTGGDGRPYLDYNLIVKTYLEVKNMNEVSRMLNIDAGHISTILKIKNIPTLTSEEVGKNKGKNVAMLNEKKEIIKTFASLNEAGQYLLDIGLATGVRSSVRTHIKEVAEGKRKTAYKHFWKFI